MSQYHTHRLTGLPWVVHEGRAAECSDYNHAVPVLIERLRALEAVAESAQEYLKAHTLAERDRLRVNLSIALNALEPE